MDKVQFNQQIVSMRKVVKQSKVQVVHQLTRQIQRLHKKSGSVQQVEKNKRRAVRLGAEIEAIKKLTAFQITIAAARSNVTFEEACKQSNATAADRALARLANYNIIHKKVALFKDLIKPDLLRMGKRKKRKIKREQAIARIQKQEDELESTDEDKRGSRSKSEIISANVSVLSKKTQEQSKVRLKKELQDIEQGREENSKVGNNNEEDSESVENIEVIENDTNNEDDSEFFVEDETGSEENKFEFTSGSVDESGNVHLSVKQTRKQPEARLKELEDKEQDNEDGSDVESNDSDSESADENDSEGADENDSESTDENDSESADENDPESADANDLENAEENDSESVDKDRIWSEDKDGDEVETAPASVSIFSKKTTSPASKYLTQPTRPHRTIKNAVAAVDVDKRSHTSTKHKPKSSFFTTDDGEDLNDQDENISNEDDTTSENITDKFKEYSASLKKDESIKEFLKSRTAEGKKSMNSVFMSTLSNKKIVSDKKPKKNRPGQKERQRINKMKDAGIPISRQQLKRSNVDQNPKPLCWVPAVDRPNPVKSSAGVKMVPGVNCFRKKMYIDKDNPAKKGGEKLHPSWEAKRKKKEQESKKVPFEGKKIMFDED